MQVFKTGKYLLFLFNNKHVVVKELLQFFIDKVDGDLLKAIVFKDLKASNVKHSSEVGLLHGGINQSFITFDDEPFENPVKGGPGDTTNTKGSLEKLRCFIVVNPKITHKKLLEIPIETSILISE